MIVSIRTLTPVAKVLVETLPQWVSPKRQSAPVLVVNGDAEPHPDGTGGLFQAELAPREYLLTVTEMVPVRTMVVVGNEKQEAKQSPDTDPKQNLRAGETRQYKITVLTSGQVKREVYKPENPDPERMKMKLDAAIETGKREAARAAGSGMTMGPAPATPPSMRIRKE